MIQLHLTTEGLSAKTRNTDIIFTKFIAGSGADENGQTIQTQKQIVPVTFSQVYNKNQQYTNNGITYTEQIDHVKIMGSIQSLNATEDYNLTEIALMAKEGENGTEFCFAYGVNAQENMLITSNEDTEYSIIVDIAFDTTPNVTINTTETGVTYTDLINHINTNVTSTAHGIKYENQDLKVNNVSLDICKNAIFQKTTGATVVDTLPTASMLYNEKLVYDKSTASSYKCVKTTELEVGDYIYEDNNTWVVGDGTEQGALEVVSDSTTPTSTEIKLTQAQSLFMQWNSVNNIDKRLSLVESVSLGGITDIIDTLQNQIDSINNALTNPFPSWGASTTYSVGDICIANTFKSYQYLECIQAGESDLTIPSYAEVGQMVTDNEVKWLVCDFRDSAPVGSFRSDYVQRVGWLKCNGAEVNRADYPRLWAYAVANNLVDSSYTPSLPLIAYPGFFGEGDGSTTFTLPDFEDYFVRYSFTRVSGHKQASQMASHTHTCQDHTGSHDHTAGNQSASHKHQYGNALAYVGGQAGSSGVTYGNSYGLTQHSSTTKTNTQDTNHTHTINSKSITHKHTINSTGSGSNTYPDNIAMQMYIKY